MKNGTSDEIVARLNQAVNKTLTKPKVREAIAELGAEPVGGTPSEFDAAVKTEIAHWTKIVKESGIKMRQ